MALMVLTGNCSTLTATGITSNRLTAISPVKMLVKATERCNEDDLDAVVTDLN